MILLVIIGSVVSFITGWWLKDVIIKFSTRQTDINLFNWNGFQGNIFYNLIIFILIYWPLLKIEKFVLNYKNQVEIKKNVR